MKIIKIPKVSRVKVYSKNEGKNTDKSNYTVRSMLHDLFKWENFFQRFKVTEQTNDEKAGF